MFLYFVRPSFVNITLLACLAPTASAQATIQAKSADQFVDSMGINVHMEAANTPYRDYDVINDKLQALGMRHFRDEINNTNPSFVKELNHIGTLGYTLCGLIEGGNDYPPLHTKLKAEAVVPLIENLRPTIEAVEGPNEPDDGGFVYDNMPYPRGAIAESIDLWNIVKGNHEIGDLPVVSLSEGTPRHFAILANLTPPPIDYAAFGNMHAYQNGGVGDFDLIEYLHYSRLLTGADPLWTTEMGYHNYTNYLTDGEQQGVSPRAAAIYLPSAFLASFDRGVRQTFSYELIDESYDPHLVSGSAEGHYGLLNYDDTPKPAYIALKNLIELLREPGTEPFEPGSLTVTFDNAPGTIEYSLLQKSNGDYYLALWNDVSVYQVATSTTTPGQNLYPHKVPVQIRFSSPYTFTVYAPNDASGVNPTNAYTIGIKPDSLEIDLPAQVLLLKISSVS